MELHVPERGNEQVFDGSVGKGTVVCWKMEYKPQKTIS